MQIALLETSALHGEVYPTFVSHFIELGCNVCLYTVKQNLKDYPIEHYKFPEDKFKLVDLDSMLDLCNELNAYDLCIMMTVFGGSLAVTDNMHGVLHDIGYAQGQSNLATDLLQNNRAIVLRKGIKWNGLDLPHVPCVVLYAPPRLFKEQQFISVGGTWDSNLRNFAQIFDSIDKLNLKSEVTFVGVDAQYFDKDVTIKARNKRIPFDELLGDISSAKFILAGIDETTSRYKQYLSHGIFGSFTFSVCLARPLIIYKPLALEYGLDETMSVHYIDDLTSAMQRAMDMSLTEYESMQHNLEQYKQILRQQGFVTLQTIINDQ